MTSTSSVSSKVIGAAPIDIDNERKFEPTRATQDFIITRVRDSADLEAVRVLFTRYADELNLDLTFQSFAEELASLPGKYSPDMGGEILLARRPNDPNTSDNQTISNMSETGHQRQDRHQNRKRAREKEQGEPLGCIALRSLHSSSYLVDTPLPAGVKIAEVKRLYAMPFTRGMGVGHALTGALIQVAKELGYDELRLDTLPSMKAGIKIYEKLGFVDVDAYCFNPITGCKFMGYKLR